MVFTKYIKIQGIAILQDFINRGLDVNFLQILYNRDLLFWESLYKYSPIGI